MKYWLAFLLLFPFSAAAEFCADLKAKYGDGIMRCIPEVEMQMDDWVVATVPLPMQRRPQGAQDGAASFGLDARDLDRLPLNTWTRLYPGPDKTFYNTGYGRFAPADPHNPIPGQMPEAHVTGGVSTLSATNYGIEVPTPSGVPLGGGFVGTPYGNGKMLYFGGGHSGYRANRVNVWDLRTGRWSQSQYTPDMGSQVAGAIGYTTPTPPGIGCKTKPHDTAARYFSTTGDTIAGSKIVKNVANLNNMCPIVGLCPGQEAQTGGYGIFGTSVAADAAIYSVNRATNEITMTHAATVTATGVELTGGKPHCSEGGAPNGSTGGRGWWEHMDNRYNWDSRANAWMLVQASGTWFYDDTVETWTRASGPHPGTEALLCGGSDYTALSTHFAPELNRTLAWCSTGGVFGYDYGSGAPNYTGAKWVQLNQVPSAIQNPQTDVLGQAVWDKVKKKFFYLSAQSTGKYGGTGVANPIVYWFDPFAVPSCETNPYPCGTIGRLDGTKPNHPQSYFVPIDSTTQQPDKSNPCYTSICQFVTASLTVDDAGSLYIVGRRAGDAQVALWQATDPTGPNETWTILQDFYFNTYDNKGLRLLNGKPPAESSYEFDIGSSAMGMLNYIPERNAFLLITRSGSGNGGASTRGSGNPAEGGCYLNGVPDDCFRMYGLRLGGSAPVASFADANQHGLTGSWYSPATSGQGIQLEVYPNVVGPGTGFVQAGWFTFKNTGDGEQAWYSFSGNVLAGQTSASVTIYQHVGGNFNAAPKTAATQVGSATLRFSACDRGSLDYAFSDGSGRSGSIELTRLTRNVTCVASGAPPVNADFALSGHWYDPATDGQGVTVEINPLTPVAFFGWYTYAPNGAAAGVAGQRWYTGQSGYTAGARTLAMTLYETRGGLFDAPTTPAPSTLPVGTATLSFQSCTAAMLFYSFSGGTNAGASGTINLSRVGPTPPGCSP